MPPAAAVCLLSLAALVGCFDQQMGDAVAVPGVGSQLAGIGRLPVARPAAAARKPGGAVSAPVTRGLVGSYAIDVAATSREAGLLGPLVAAKVRGASLELRGDRTYVGYREGVAESAGRWRVLRGRLILEQTHELDRPAEQRGEGSVRDGVLTLTTVRQGIEVVLVFRRQPRK